MKVYDPNLMSSIPADVIAAAEKISRYFAERNMKDWVLGGVMERNDGPVLVRELAESDPLVTHSDGEISCGLCRRSGDDAPGGKPAHLPTCLWLRARKMTGLT